MVLETEDTSMLSVRYSGMVSGQNNAAVVIARIDVGQGCREISCSFDFAGTFFFRCFLPGMEWPLAINDDEDDVIGQFQYFRTRTTVARQKTDPVVTQ